MNPVLVVDGKKLCSKCGIEKNEHDFDADKRSATGLRSQCRECAKVYNKYDPVRKRSYLLMRKYGITVEFYDSMLSDQNNSCAICEKHISEFENQLCVDHDHELFGPESIRGILCKPCNSALGLMGDTLEDIQKALAYMLGYYGSTDNGND